MKFEWRSAEEADSTARSFASILCGVYLKMINLSIVICPLLFLVQSVCSRGSKHWNRQGIPNGYEMASDLALNFSLV